MVSECVFDGTPAAVTGSGVGRRSRRRVAALQAARRVKTRGGESVGQRGGTGKPSPQINFRLLQLGVGPTTESVGGFKGGRVTEMVEIRGVGYSRVLTEY